MTENDISLSLFCADGARAARGLVLFDTRQREKQNIGDDAVAAALLLLLVVDKRRERSG